MISGGDHAENGRLWFRSFVTANGARMGALTSTGMMIATVADCGRVHRLCRVDAKGHEEADCLFVHCAHGFRDARILSVVVDETTAAARRSAITGGMVQMVSHGLISGAMFLCVGVLYDRVHSRQIADYGGVANTMPTFAALLVLFAMANAGLPGTSGFVGEFMVIIASFKANFWYAFLAATTLILGAAIHAVDGEAGGLR